MPIVGDKMDRPFDYYTTRLCNLENALGDIIIAALRGEESAKLAEIAFGALRGKGC